MTTIVFQEITHKYKYQAKGNLVAPQSPKQWLLDLVYLSPYVHEDFEILGRDVLQLVGDLGGHGCKSDLVFGVGLEALNSDLFEGQEGQTQDAWRTLVRRERGQKNLRKKKKKMIEKKYKIQVFNV